jgi:hypothetical protein
VKPNGADVVLNEVGGRLWRLRDRGKWMDPVEAV